MKIAIIGAGIAGLATASFLARLGFETEIFENFTTAKAIGAGLLLQPPGQFVLQELGVLDTLRKTSPKIQALEAINAQNKTVLDVKYTTLGDSTSHGLGVERSTLHSLLLNKANEYNIPIHLKHRVQSLEQSANNVTICFTHQPPQEFDFVIVCSGSKSAWINNKQFGRTANPFPWSCLWTTIDLPRNLTADMLHQRVDGAHLMAGVLPISCEPNQTFKAAFYWSIHSKKLNPCSWDLEKIILNPLRALWPDAFNQVSQVSQNSFAHAPYYNVWCKQPISGRVAIIGDAAHGTSPQLGQGVTSALLDAKAISKAIHRNSRDPEELRKEYVQQRIAHQRYIRYCSILLTPFFQHNYKAYGWLRDIFMPASLGISPISKISAKTLASQYFLNTPL